MIGSIRFKTNPMKRPQSMVSSQPNNRLREFKLYKHQSGSTDKAVDYFEHL